MKFLEELTMYLGWAFFFVRLVIYLIGAVLLFITIPIWYIPYLIYKKIKYGYY